MNAMDFAQAVAASRGWDGVPLGQVCRRGARRTFALEMVQFKNLFSEHMRSINAPCARNYMYMCARGCARVCTETYRDR
jgi:hypothetical protein